MHIIPTEEIKALKEVYKPYLKGAVLVNAPPEAVEALEKVLKWYKEKLDE